MDYLNRILDDGTDRDNWLVSRTPAVCASDVAKFAKLSSVHLYLADKLDRTPFHGNKYTESGNRWEPLMLAWAGMPENKALIHSPDERGFAATPDGLSITPTTGRGAECKAKHNKIVTGPTLGEWRQLSWQFVAVPEFEEIEFIWQELVIDRDTGEWVPRTAEPKNLTVKRGDAKVQTTIAQVMPIATEVLARLTAALEFERELLAS